MRFVFLLFLFLLPGIVWAQQSDSQLAYTYYQNKEYEKAAEVFLKLYERTRSSNFLDYHVICLINAKQFGKAEDVLKKFLKADDNNKEFLVNLGYVYEQQGKTNKSQEYYNRAIRKLIPSHGDIQNLANLFRNLREYEWAIKTYLRGRELLQKPDAYMRELGDNYMMERDYEQMFALFARALELNPGDINTITSKLNFARSFDIVNNVDTVIDRNLIMIFQKKDYSPAFDELAVWFGLQKQNYPYALKHAMLLNQKMENKLHHFMDIGRDAARDGKYVLAQKSYQQILERGKENNNYYASAEKEMLNCRYQECEHTHAALVSYQYIAGDCEKFLQEYGYSYGNADLILLLSDLYAYRLNLPDSANQVLEKGSRIRMGNRNMLNTLKSKRADLLAYVDNPWEATILYTQVEKANPNDNIGYEAKLKKARLAYYTGDLLWAKAQFDVLKGATSKLISNDAILMSHFIDMNYEEEGDNSALEKLAKTEYLLYKNQAPQALPVLDSLISNSSPGIADYAALLKARHWVNQGQPEKAVPLLRQLKEKSSETYIQAEALFTWAGIQASMQKKTEAMELYKTLVSEYSGSVYSVKSGKRYRELEKQQP